MLKSQNLVLKIKKLLIININIFIIEKNLN